MASLQEIQRRTFIEMCQRLNEHGLCCVERPTGFGKTKLFMDYARMHPNAKFLYVYDMESTKSDIKDKYRPSNVEFLSYAAISRERDSAKVKQYMLGSPWHTMIFDEAHLMGGENITKVLDTIIPLAIRHGVRVLGGTATRLRTDLVDVSKRFFHGCGVSEYTLLDAIDDGIMPEPVWALTAHYNTMLKQLHNAVGDRPNSYVRATLRQLDKAYANIDGVSTVYADTVKETYGYVPNIMRFIIFYPTVKSLSDNMQRDIGEFQKAFPNHDIAYAALSTGKGHMRTITEVEGSFNLKYKQVQLIFAVDMLNQSYHSNMLTGIVMYRSTFSNIIFTQQMGRVLSVTAKKPGIVFDNVGNALVKPERAAALLQLLSEDKSKVPSGNSKERGHINIRLRATREFIQFQQVYQRVMATQHITQEQIDYAKYITSDMGAPIQLVMDGLRLDEDTARRIVQDG